MWYQVCVVSFAVSQEVLLLLLLFTFGSCFTHDTKKRTKNLRIAPLLMPMESHILPLFEGWGDPEISRDKTDTQR